MSHIKVALIGLSTSAKTSWAAEAHLPYLVSPRGKLHYDIVALLNSTIEAAEASKAHFQLPSHVKTYGDASTLAADPNVDLVVCCTRVDNHIPTIEPSVTAAKAVYVEWPIAENFAKATNVLSGGPGNKYPNSIAGLQGRVSPLVRTLKALLHTNTNNDNSRIGRILSSDVRAFGNLLPRDQFPESLAYFAERAVGGNPVTIAYAHMIDFVHEVLGEWAEGKFDSRMQIQRPDVTILGKDGAPLKTIRSDVPDLVAVHGRLAPGKADITKDATLSVVYRSGQPFKGAPAFEWTINGEKGEIRVISPAGPYLHSDSYSIPFTIEVHDHATDKVENVEWDWEEWQKELPVRARNVAELYERYARWVKNGQLTGKLGDESEWPRVHDAVNRQEELEVMFQQSLE